MKNRVLLEEGIARDEELQDESSRLLFCVFDDDFLGVANCGWDSLTTCFVVGAPRSQARAATTP